MKLHFLLPILATAFLSGCFGPADDAGEEQQSSSDASSDRSADRERLGELRETEDALEDKVKEMRKLVDQKEEIAKVELQIVGEMEEVRNYAKRVDELHSQLTQSLESWRAATRKSFIGVKLPEITTIAGETYKDVEITGVDDVNLSISHSGGNDSIEISSLPVALRKNLIHEPTVLAEKGL